MSKLKENSTDFKVRVVLDIVDFIQLYLEDNNIDFKTLSFKMNGKMSARQLKSKLTPYRALHVLELGQVADILFALDLDISTLIFKKDFPKLWLHKETKVSYELITKFNEDTSRVEEFPVSVLYRNCETNQLWGRPLDKFLERFEPIERRGV